MLPATFVADPIVEAPEAMPAGEYRFTIPLRADVEFDSKSELELFHRFSMGGAGQSRSFTLVQLTSESTTQVGTRFAPLRVRFLEGDLGIAGIPVTFTSPATGPRGTFAEPATVLTDATGTAEAPVLTAGTQAGEFTVRATIVGGIFLDIPLTNLAGPVAVFGLSGAASVTEGEAFSITLTAFDAFGNIASDYAGAVRLISDDSRAQLPGAVTIARADEGVRTIDGLKFFSPGERTLVVGDSAAGVEAEARFAVGNIGPANLALTIDRPVIDEGDSNTVEGTFANIDSADTHTIVIHWGDGSPDTRLTLAAGVTTFRAQHRWNDDFDGPIRVTVIDSQGASIEADVQVRVENVAPDLVLPASTGALIGKIGEAVTLSGSFTDPGDDTWVGTVDYGDGAGPQPLLIGTNRGFELRHVYTAEGTFMVVVSLSDGDGGIAIFRERVAVLLPGTGTVKMVVIGPGQTGEIHTDTYGIVFENSSTTTPAVFLAALVDRATIERLAGNPSIDPNAKIIAVDFRVLDADPASKLTIVLNYEPSGVPPELRYVDPDTGQFVLVRGSTRFENSFKIDRDNKRVTLTLDGSTSSPTLSQLRGTLFTLTVPAPPSVNPTNPGPSIAQTPSPSPQQGFYVPPNALAGGDSANARGLVPTTALSVSSDATITLSSSDGLRRGGSDSDSAQFGPVLPPVLQFIHDLYDIREVIYEAFRMWLEHPALQAPAELPPPPIDQLDAWQIQLDAPSPELREDAPVEFAPADELPSFLIDASAAIAARQPWWLADAAPAAPQGAGDEAIPLPQVTAEPSDEERATMALAGIWIGGHALAIAAPHVPEETPADPRRTRLRVHGKPKDE